MWSLLRSSKYFNIYECVCVPVCVPVSVCVSQRDCYACNIRMKNMDPIGCKISVRKQKWVSLEICKIAYLFLREIRAFNAVLSALCLGTLLFRAVVIY